MTLPTRPLPYLVLLGIGLGVLVARAAWGQEASVTGSGPDVWQSVGVGVGLIVTAAAAGIAAWLRSEPARQERRRADGDADAPDHVTRTELRAMVTEATERAMRAADGQHERVRAELVRLERRIEQVDARLTADQHAGAERREHLARELGQIAAGIDHLRAAAGER